MNLVFFYRKKQPERHSIEKVYDTLIPFFMEFDISKIMLPYRSKGVLKRLLNILFTYSNSGYVNHITGDINYINLLLFKKVNILTIHDIYPLHRTVGIKRFLLKLLWFDIPIKLSSKIIVVSEFTKNELNKHFSIPEKKICVIHNCISQNFKATPFKFNSEKPTIFVLGTKINKNLFFLIDVIKELQVNLIILGRLNSTLSDKLKTAKIDYENYNNVSDTKLIDLYIKSDLVSFISSYEGFGLPIIEAQAIGRPVITSNVASMPEVAGEGALLVNPNSKAEIRAGIIEIIQNDELRELLVRRGFENVKRFDPQLIANQYIKLYKELINEY